MELKCKLDARIGSGARPLIEPYGIEINYLVKLTNTADMPLIEPYGIEIGTAVVFEGFEIHPLIEPYGIEISFILSSSSS